MRVVNLQELDRIREDAVRFWRPWKQRSLTLDSILSDDWKTVWDDLTVEDSEPLVENIALEALEDKAAQAATGVMPNILVPARRGTRQDKAEKNAERRRRVATSYWDRSGVRDRLMLKAYLDWWGHGAMYFMPWHTQAAQSVDRLAYFMRVNPRQVYPLSHDPTGRLTAAVITRVRNYADLTAEYGHDHPALLEIMAHRIKLNRDPSAQVEETWYMDESQICVMVTDRSIPMQAVPYRTIAPINLWGVKDSMSAWLMEPQKHGMDWMPLVEGKRDTFDDDYRSPLDSMIPRLRTMQNIMARWLEAVADNVFAPVLMENIMNPEDYGPGAELQGDGSGNARIEYAPKPINFEAQQAIQDQAEMARRQGKHPANRSGEASASIVSATGERQLLGSFNAELAQAQIDVAGALRMVTQRTAHLDEIYCFGKKTIEGFENGKAYAESYDPTTLWARDYRIQVSYGPASGLDAQNLLVRLATGKNMGALSKRSFIQQSGLVDDPLQEERDITLEIIADSTLALMVQQAQAGNPTILQSLAAKIDDDQMTVREAVFATIKEAQTVPEGGSGAGGPGGPGGAGPDAFTQQRSMEAGGIPGNAEALRGAGSALSRGLPANVRGGIQAEGSPR